jgi:hypothetical protein
MPKHNFQPSSPKKGRLSPRTISIIS